MKRIAFCLSAAPFLFLFSCVSPRYVYTPTAVNNPYFTQKHDAKLAAFLSGGATNSDSDYVRGFDLMGAYAISNHVALTAIYHHRTENNFYDESYVSPFDTSLVRYNRSAWEVGAGYFQPLTNNKSIILNFYGGAGRGSNHLTEAGRTNNQSYTRYHDVMHTNFYLQPGINLQSTAVRFGVLYKFNFVWYNNVVTNYSNAELDDFHLNSIQNDPQLFKELAFNLQLAFPGLKGSYIEGQLSLSTNVAYRHSRPFNASAGLVIDPFRLLKKR